MNFYKLVAQKTATGRFYDCYDAKIVRAASPERARKIASESTGDEGRETWLNVSFSTCQRITTQGEEGEILGSFNAG
jgi:hypothetical protein